MIHMESHKHDFSYQVFDKFEIFKKKINTDIITICVG